MSDRGVESRVSTERIEAAARGMWAARFRKPSASMCYVSWEDAHSLDRANERESAEAALVAAGVADLESALRELYEADLPDYEAVLERARVVLGDDE